MWIVLSRITTAGRLALAVKILFCFCTAGRKPTEQFTVFKNDVLSAALWKHSQDYHHYQEVNENTQPYLSQLAWGWGGEYAHLKQCTVQIFYSH